MPRPPSGAAPIRTYLLLNCAIVGFLGGLLVLSSDRLGSTWHGLGLLLIGCLCVAMTNPKLWPRAFSRRQNADAGPVFEVGEPNDPGSAPAPTPLIQAMHRVRGKRRKPED